MGDARRAGVEKKPVVEFKFGGVVDSGVSDGQLRVSFAPLGSVGRDAEPIAWLRTTPDWSRGVTPLHRPYQATGQSLTEPHRE